MRKDLGSIMREFLSIEKFHNSIHTAVVAQGHFYCKCKKCESARYKINFILDTKYNGVITTDFTKKNCFIYKGIGFLSIFHLAENFIVEL
jgi:hypothetical protein